MARAMIAAVAAATLVAIAEASSTHIATLCKGATCTSREQPILDYDPSTDSCICRPHPCWNDRGEQHSCAHDPRKPYLVYEYLRDGKLFCDCSAEPQYLSPYIAKDLCKGK